MSETQTWEWRGNAEAWVTCHGRTAVVTPDNPFTCHVCKRAYEMIYEPPQTIPGRYRMTVSGSEEETG